MMPICSPSVFSKLMFLNDMYRNILEVQGDIVHIGIPEDMYPLTTWASLEELYESDDARRICAILPATQLELEGRGECMADKLISYLDERPPVIALAYFDECDTKDTFACLNLIIPYLTRGSVLAFSMRHDHVTPIRDIIGLGSIALQRWHASRKDCYAVI